MKSGIEMQKRSPFRRTAQLLVSVVCMSSPPAPAADALMTSPRLLSRIGVAGRAFPAPALLLRTPTKLKTTRDNNAEDDFASFNDFGQEDDGQELAREFYRELLNRQSSLELNPKENNDEANAVSNHVFGENKGGSKNTIKAVRGSRQIFTKQPTTTPASSSQDSPLFAFLSFLTPPPRPTASAGLFSGSGTTVYSSGRSIRAEIEILETTMKNNDTKNINQGWDGFYTGSPEQTEEVLRLVVLSLIVLSAAYVAVEASGGTSMISWDDAAASFNDAMSLMSDATKDGMSGIMVSAGNGDVFLGEEAARLMKESAEWAASVGEAVRSVEDLVLC